MELSNSRLRIHIFTHLCVFAPKNSLNRGRWFYFVLFSLTCSCKVTFTVTNDLHATLFPGRFARQFLCISLKPYCTKLYMALFFNGRVYFFQLVDAKEIVSINISGQGVISKNQKPANQVFFLGFFWLPRVFSLFPWLYIWRRERHSTKLQTTLSVRRSDRLVGRLVARSGCYNTLAIFKTNHSSTQSAMPL